MAVSEQIRRIVDVNIVLDRGNIDLLSSLNRAVLITKLDFFFGRYKEYANVSELRNDLITAGYTNYEDLPEYRAVSNFFNRSPRVSSIFISRIFDISENLAISSASYIYLNNEVKYQSIGVVDFAAGDTVTISGFKDKSFNIEDGQAATVTSSSASSEIGLVLSKAPKSSFIDDFGVITHFKSFTSVPTVLGSPISVMSLSKDSGNRLTAVLSSIPVGVSNGTYLQISGANEVSYNVIGVITNIDSGNNTIGLTVAQPPSEASATGSIVFKTITSTAIASVTAHGYTTGDLVEIKGFTQSIYNTSSTFVTVIDADRFSYDIGTIPLTMSDLTASGPGMIGRQYELTTAYRVPSSTEVRVYTSISHRLQVGDYVDIVGFVPNSLNGVNRVTGVTGSSFVMSVGAIPTSPRITQVGSGYKSLVVISLVPEAIGSRIAELRIPVNGLIPGVYVELQGYNQSEFNGRFKIIEVNNDSYKIELNNPASVLSPSGLANYVVEETQEEAFDNLVKTLTETVDYDFSYFFSTLHIKIDGSVDYSVIEKYAQIAYANKKLYLYSTNNRDLLRSGYTGFEVAARQEGNDYVSATYAKDLRDMIEANFLGYILQYTPMDSTGSNAEITGVTRSSVDNLERSEELFLDSYNVNYFYLIGSRILYANAKVLRGDFFESVRYVMYLTLLIQEKLYTLLQISKQRGKALKINIDSDERALTDTTGGVLQSESDFSRISSYTSPIIVSRDVLIGLVSIRFEVVLPVAIVKVIVNGLARVDNI